MKHAKPAKLYLSFKEIFKKYGFQNKATSNVKIKETLIGITFMCEVYMREVTFTTTTGIFNLHPSKGTHWVMVSDKFYFDSYGCPSATNIPNHINNGLYSEYQFQKNDSYCAAYCLYMFYLTDIIGDKNAVLNLYYQNLNLKNEENYSLFS